MFKNKRRQAWSYEKIDAAFIKQKFTIERALAIHKAAEELRSEMNQSAFDVINNEVGRVTQLMEMVFDLQEKLALVIASTDREIADLKMELAARL